MIVAAWVVLACAAVAALWVFFNPRKLRIRRLVRDFTEASKRHSYYMAEGDLERAKIELRKMSEIIKQEKSCR